MNARSLETIFRCYKISSCFCNTSGGHSSKASSIALVQMAASDSAWPLVSPRFRGRSSAAERPHAVLVPAQIKALVGDSSHDLVADSIGPTVNGSLGVGAVSFTGIAPNSIAARAGITRAGGRFGNKEMASRQGSLPCRSVRAKTQNADRPIDNQCGFSNDILMCGEGADSYKFGSSAPRGAADAFGKDTILDADGKGSLQINGQTLEGTFTSFGERGAYRLKLADGSGAGLSVYNDTASTTGKSAILKFSGNLANQITIRNFDEAAAKGSQGFMGIKIDPQQAVLVKASNYATPPNPFEPWDFNPASFAAGADSAVTERNGKSFTVYLQQGATKAFKPVLKISCEIGILGTQNSDSLIAINLIALCAGFKTAKHEKRLKNDGKTCLIPSRCRKFKGNWRVASVEHSQSAVEVVVIVKGASA